MKIQTLFIAYLLAFTPIAAGAKPVARITAPAGGKFAKGTPIEIKYEVTGAPASASIVLYLYGWRPSGSNAIHGALMNSSRQLDRSGKGSFTWDGASIVDEAGDFAVMIERPAEPGRYVFRAHVYDKKQVGVGGGPRQAMPDDEKLIAEAESARFEIYVDPKVRFQGKVEADTKPVAPPVATPVATPEGARAKAAQDKAIAFAKAKHQKSPAYEDNTPLVFQVINWGYYPKARHWVFAIETKGIRKGGSPKADPYEASDFIKVTEKGDVCEVGDMGDSDAPDSHPCF